jgi:hypothetical protein
MLRHLKWNWNHSAVEETVATNSKVVKSGTIVELVVQKSGQEKESWRIHFGAHFNAAYFREH